MNRQSGFSKRAFLALGFLAFATALAYLALFRLSDLSGKMLLAVLDIGQGDAILASIGPRTQILFDGGPSGGGILRRLGQEMPFFDRTLELVVATHADADHVGGLIEVFSRYKVKYVLVGDFPKNTATHREFLDKVNNSGAVVLRPRAGQRIRIGSGAALEIIGPPEAFEVGESNESSIVARLRFGRTAALLTGDAPLSEEAAILASGAQVRADVLKIAHHGSHTSTGESFLDAVQPQFAAISVGKKNRYGHPAEEVLDRLVERGIQILRTDFAGTVEFFSDGQSFAVKRGGS